MLCGGVPAAPRRRRQAIGDTAATLMASSCVAGHYGRKAHGPAMKTGMLALLLADIHVTRAAAPLRPAAGCLDLRADCGAGNGHQQDDDTRAFVECQRQLASTGGCVSIPPGEYQVMGVPLNTSNIHWQFSGSAVIKPFHAYTTNSDYTDLFIVGATNASGWNVAPRGEPKGPSLTPVTNVAFTGPSGGHMVIDMQHPPVCPWPVRGVRFGSVSNFSLHNVLVKQANNNTDPSLPCPGLRPALSMSHGPDWNSPSYGHVENITALGGWPGYGLIQVQAATFVHFENLDSTGGVTLRMETGGDNGYVADITGNNIICRDGSTALMAGPHAQVNGKFNVKNLYAYSCTTVASAGGGFAQKGKPAGSFVSTQAIILGSIKRWKLC